MRAKWWMLGGGVALAALWLTVGPRPAPAPEVPSAATEPPARRYRLALTVRDEARLPAGGGAVVPIVAQVGLRSELVVVAPRAKLRRIRFEAVDAATLAVGDEAKAAPVAELIEGLEARVLLGEAGAVEAVQVPPETSLAAERLVKLVVSELAWSPPARGAGPVRAGHRIGESQASFTWEGRGHFVRTREGYQTWAAFDALDVRRLKAEITGGARGVVDADGHLTSLRVDERVLARHPAERQPLLHADTRLELDLVGRAPEPRWAAARFGPARALFEHPTSEAATARAEDARVAGLTGEALVAALDSTGGSGQFADHAQMLARATGLLRKQPALVAELGRRFSSERTTDPERTLLLDLLVGAGTPEAQAEVVALLETPRVRAHPERHLWDQRLSFVAAPTPDTVRYAERAFETREGVDGTTASYVLGAIADHLTKSGEPEAASAVAVRLVERLEASSDSAARAHLLSALGNAGQPALAERITSYASSSDPQLRLAAAKALRKTDVANARATLVQLSADPSAVVQRRALLSLTRMSDLRAGELEALEASVRREAVAETSLGALVNLMAGQPCSPQRDAVLRAVRARPKEGGAVIDQRTRLLEARCG